MRQFACGLVLTSALGLGLFSTALAQQEVDGYGPPEAESHDLHGPFPSNYKELSLGALKRDAFDPDAMQIGEIPSPHKAIFNGALRQPREVWVSCVLVNGKNRYGAFVGFRTYAVILKNGTVIDVIDRSYSMTVFERICPGMR